MKKPYITIHAVNYTGSNKNHEIYYTITIPRKNGKTQYGGVAKFEQPIEIDVDESQDKLDELVEFRNPLESGGYGY